MDEKAACRKHIILSYHWFQFLYHYWEKKLKKDIPEAFSLQLPGMRQCSGVKTDLAFIYLFFHLHPVFAWECFRGQIPGLSYSWCRPEEWKIVKRCWTRHLGLEFPPWLCQPDFVTHPHSGTLWFWFPHLKNEVIWMISKVLSRSRPMDHWCISFSEFSQ